MKIPLRLILVVPFVLQISVAVGAIGWLSWRNGQAAVNDVASQLRNEISDRIKEKLQAYISAAHQANQITADAIELGELNPIDGRSLEHHLWRKIQVFPTLNLLLLGDRQGRHTGVGRNADGSISIYVLEGSDRKLHRYLADSKGDRAKFLGASNPNFDPRQRPWYKAAIKVNRPTWTEMYADFFSHDIAVSAVQPVNDTAGNFYGVVGSDLIFAQANEFLRSLKIGHSGQTFIIERTGKLVASSTADPLFAIKGDRAEQLRSIESDNVVIKEATKYLTSQLGDLKKIDTPQQIDFEINHQRQFLQITPLQDGKGIDWLIVTAIPESDFMTRIYDNNRSTAILCLLALIISIIFGIAIAQWISRSIQPLIQASQKIADGDLKLVVPINQTIEDFGALSQSFNKMTANLCIAFTDLQESNAYLNTIINNLSSGLLVVDVNNRIGYVNQSLIDMFDLNPTELIGRDYDKLFDPSIIALIGQAQQQRDRVFVAELNLSHHRIGQAAATSIHLIQTGCEIESCIGYMLLVRDITLEKEVDRLKTEFLSNISHELRTPLVSILGFSKIVDKKFTDSLVPLIPIDNKKGQRSAKQIQDNLGIIVSESQRLTAIITNVLDITNLESDRVAWNMQPLAINDLIMDSISKTALLFQTKNLPVHVKLEDDLPEVMVDRDRIAQVLLHLIANAAKFTDSGSVSFSSQHDVANDQIIVSISDTGIGIDPDDFAKVFEKFKQVGDILTDKPQGTGLGLPISQAIISKHGGKLWFESELGKGSTFSFSLPTVS